VKPRIVTLVALIVAATLVAARPSLQAVQAAQGGGNQAASAPPPTPKASAPVDLTGYWVSLITEDWRYRMVTPPRSDYQGLPMTPAAVKLADMWDPVADEKAGLQCKSYAAPAIMHVAGRLHVTWQDDYTLRMDTDAGTQTRLFHFRPVTGKLPARSWQGESAAQWDLAGRGRGPNAVGGSLKVVTTNLRAGYLRKNGVPYSENAGLSEYFDVAPQRNGDQILVATVVVDDPIYLDRVFVLASQFKKEGDGSKWEPTPCSSTW
jgi:hypothetical protein